MEDEVRDLIQISKGNELAFDGFMDRHSQNLFCYAYGILGNSELAEEAVSDVFFEVWKKRSQLPAIDNVRSWLCTITYRKAVSCMRKEMKHKRDMSIDNMQSFCFPLMESPIDNIISVEESASLNAAIDMLPAKCKHVFFLAKIEQMPYADIARLLGISLATVNYHIGFAMQTLKKKLKQA